VGHTTLFCAVEGTNPETSAVHRLNYTHITHVYMLHVYNNTMPITEGIDYEIN